MSDCNEDSVLWQSFKSGDTDAFKALYNKYFAVLYEYGMRVVSDRELVKDAIQDLFIKLWSNKAGIRNISYLRSYLIVSLRSTIYNLLRKNNRIKFTEDPIENSFHVEFSVESRFIHKESDNLLYSKLIAALNQLTERQKEAIYLRYIGGMGYEEIAEIMNITVKGSYKLVGRGVESLKRILTPGCFAIVIIITCQISLNIFL